MWELLLYCRHVQFTYITLAVTMVIFFNRCYIVCPIVCFLLCTSFARESLDYLPKFKCVSCDILVCVIYDTSLDFHHYKYRIEFLFYCSYDTQFH
jgi:hypothetical protein